MIKYVLAAAAVLFNVSANAATFIIQSYNNSDDTYIEMRGATEEGDYDKFMSTLTRALDSHHFDGSISFKEAPGGSAYEGARIAEVIADRNLNTRVYDSYCISACSLMWMAGNYRNVFEDGWVGFHFAYTQDTAYLEKQKNLYGWIGIQDEVAQSSHYYTAQLFKYDVAQPFEFLMFLSNSGANDIVWIGEENIDMVGTGSSVFKRKAAPVTAPTSDLKFKSVTVAGKTNTWFIIDDLPEGAFVLIHVEGAAGYQLNHKLWDSDQAWSKTRRIYVKHGGLVDLQTPTNAKIKHIKVRYGDKTWFVTPSK